MNKEWIESLNIVEVKQNKNFSNVRISFKIEHFEYGLELRLNEKGIYYPHLVYHKDYDYCPICGKRDERWVTCTPLHRQKGELFAQLVNFPSIRLDWLYLPYCFHEED